MRPSVLAVGATARLAEAGVPSPRNDAEVLLAHVLGVDRGRLILADVTEEQSAAYDALVARRAAREPLQHILGRAPFGPLDLHVGPGVFVPRPETELLAVWAARQVGRGAAIVDLCAGSGALGLYLAATVRGARVALVERDPQALEYLRENASGTGATVLDRDVTAPGLDAEIEAALGSTVDLVVCNPPYVPDGAPLDVEAALDPAAALFSGADGLDLIRALAPLCARLLRAGGAVVIEHDDSNGAGTAELLSRAGFGQVEQHRDLAGRPRYVTGRMDA
ncbi:peptide chain release factor N(5)-glutamine methyltransferase [Tsukamurella strandjordii]|uniref:Release factor glutamine methyltransferase n=1 Tax=Tsukamurella strandjordii TaxID=147577 RepID=A0AA90NKS4_9ACTN|nr:peptide chain release factor N(5)-glutamine methyltransferase [Tsukamurella strandjordii]MDP0400226.1 peptide chain release factor N(5)-glutamine methyltransferase [Tsukamurella strandjordii]